MKEELGWYFPDEEEHLIDWLKKAGKKLNGRLGYQWKKQQLCQKALEGRKMRTAIDVGAHVGLWSWNLAHWFETVLAFEPIPKHRECFLKNVQHADPPPPAQVFLFSMALGNKYGPVGLTTGPASTGDSWIDVDAIEPVTIMRQLDSYAFTNVDFIKIDCEGYEELVLLGSEETIRAWNPVICVEQKRDHAERFGLEKLGAVAFLESLGYKVVKEISGDYIMAPRVI